ncbi:LuxR C-terminal-related transcriptional regulator [Brevibacterium sp. K11IcPPYGO002]|uniref:helix-turn-helix transcriptional regulator n=1 Tax=Brevibacterium sp. K11IcPPYGO002 TaxID=3058837 RepID=UPI003D815F8D
MADTGGRTVVLEGPSGAGKSGVVRALQDAAGQSCEVLVGTHWSRGVPFALLGQLRDASEFLPDGHDCPTAVQLQVADALIELLRGDTAASTTVAAAAERIIVLDDIGFADPESLQVLSQIGRRLRDTRTLLLICLDPASTGSLDPDFQRMARDSQSARIEICDFGTDDAIELAAGRGFHNIGEHGAAALVAQSGGRLRAAEEILALLPPGRWPADPGQLPLPPAVIREVLGRIECTGSTEVEDVASALAILRRPQDLKRVMDVAGVDDIEGTIDLGVAHGVYREHDSAGRITLRLCHPTAATVILETMAPSTRRFLRRRAAETAPSEEEKLFHLSAASLGLDPELALRLITTAVDAEREGRWEDAAQLHFGAARVLPASADRDHELLAGIDALASAGRVAEVLPWVEIGKSIAPSVLRDTVLANIATHRGQAALADDLLARAENAGAVGDELNAQIALRRTLDSLVRWDGPEICAWTSRAIALSDPSEPAYVESRVVRGLGFAAQGLLAEADAELRTMAAQRLRGAQEQRLRLCAGWVAMLAGDHRRAVRDFEAAAPTHRERGSLRISLWAYGWLARVQYLLGEWDDALQTAEAGLRICDDANIPLLAQLLQWTAAEIRLWRGRPVDEVMSRTGHGAILSDYLAMQVPARLARSVAADLRGDHDGRAAALRPLLDVDRWSDSRSSFWPWGWEIVDALIAVGLSEQAAEIADSFHAHTATSGAYLRGCAEAAKARAAQDAGDLAEAERGFDAALTILMDGQNDTTVAKVLFSRGQMLRRANRRRDAVESLVRAREFYEGVGAEAHLRRCDRELRATGMAWRGSPDTDGSPAGPENIDSVILTPQEMSVADLVVQGMTNAEVSRRLFIAEKTVQYHLTHIYEKFGIRSRTELAAVHLGDGIPEV